ncbi:RNA polymerase sigma factor [Butyrivibrio sp. AE3004]|uniref:RNA polymerase sigma factor n=1 Tax=Butyrivibrio sp. AE3004 TaxID=1506994 RepID=UPI0018CC5EF8|nr:sigma-70 family RNA polymerase sigma factor [Butyrivibrio sp. AE3004]
MDEIYQKYARMVYGYLRSVAQNDDLAEELTQETFCQAIKSINRFNGSCKLSTWLCAIAKNTYLSYLRKNPQHDYTMILTFLWNRREYALQSNKKVRIDEHIHNLPEPYREVAYLVG